MVTWCDNLWECPNISPSIGEVPYISSHRPCNPSHDDTNLKRQAKHNPLAGLDSLFSLKANRNACRSMTKSTGHGVAIPTQACSMHVPHAGNLLHCKQKRCSNTYTSLSKSHVCCSVHHNAGLSLPPHRCIASLASAMAADGSTTCCVIRARACWRSATMQTKLQQRSVLPSSPLKRRAAAKRTA